MSAGIRLVQIIPYQKWNTNALLTGRVIAAIRTNILCEALPDCFNICYGYPLEQDGKVVDLRKVTGNERAMSLLSRCRQHGSEKSLLSGFQFFRGYMMQSLLPAFCSLLLLSMYSSNAHAYLDPGSISLALQAITAAVAGAVLTGKYWFWRSLTY